MLACGPRFGAKLRFGVAWYVRLVVTNVAIQVAIGSVDGHLRADDEALARLGRSHAWMRLRLGELLDAHHRSGGHHELGFSSIDAYALERCGRPKRWCAESRRVARRIRERELGQVRRAMQSGRLSWSMAELVVRNATAADEAELLERARRSTVREMRMHLSPDGGPVEPPEVVRTSRSVGAGERLLFETTRMGITFLNGMSPGDEATLTAMLGEAETSLYALIEASADICVPEVPPSPESWKAPDETEAPNAREPLLPVGEDAPIPTHPNAIDRRLRKLVRALAERDLEIGRLAQRLVVGCGWRRLGYASREQYATERVGMSLSSLEHRATLARRAAGSPELRTALVNGSIGYEAAMQIARIDRLGRSMLAAWIARAKQRTVLGLRHEVNAVLAMVALDLGASRAPPDDAALAQIEELERRVQSGKLYRSLFGGRLDPQMSVTLRGGAGCEIQMSVPAELRHHYEHIEALFQRFAGPRASFVAFMCFSFWRAWLPFFENHNAKWKDLHLRDLHRCTSPVCDRSDVTPHHLRFQAHGGGDELENMTSLCSWCHLHGIHEGRLRARPPASKVRWEIGRQPIMEVIDREVIAR